MTDPLVLSVAETARLFDAAAEAARTADIPADPFSPDVDRLLAAAERAGTETLELAARIRRARRIARWDRTWRRIHERGHR